MVENKYNKAHFKTKNSHIKPEDAYENTCYAFTINPSDSLQQFELSSLRRLHDFKRDIEKILKRDLYPYTSDYLFNMEVSANGRLHLHGVIRINDLLGFYTKCIPDMIKYASTELDTIEDPETWINYCIKQARIFGQFDPMIDRKSQGSVIPTQKSTRQVLYESAFPDPLDYIGTK